MPDNTKPYRNATMQTRQIVIPADFPRTPADWHTVLAPIRDFPASLLLLFGSTAALDTPGLADALQACCPAAVLLGCSSAGDIAGDSVQDAGATLTAVQFAQTRLRSASVSLPDMTDSFAVGQALGERLQAPDLAAVFVLGPGLEINGSALVNGLTGVLGTQVPITGGLAGDGSRFARTLTLGPDGVSERAVVAVGFYGSTALRFAHGSFGGWEVFGLARKVTRCQGNVLYELDGEPALAVYKRYLGEYARDLPGSGLLFPFAMLGRDHDALGLIRTILAVDEATGSLTLAGEIDPEGYLKLMHASTDRLVDGAESAADAVQAMQAGHPLPAEAGGLAILVSCVGRKLVMGDRVEEEVEAVSQVLRQSRPGLVQTGFYSYGEISPFRPGEACLLHNQTMTITWLGEA